MAQNKGLDSIFLTSCLIGMVAGGRSGFLAGEYVGETYLTNMSDSIKTAVDIGSTLSGGAFGCAAVGIALVLTYARRS